MSKRKNPYEMLLDENNKENIIFYSEDGKPMEFEQIALISLEDNKYTILHPINMGYEDDEVIIYSIFEENNEFELVEVEDEDLLKEIYCIYQKLYLQKKK